MPTNYSRWWWAQPTLQQIDSLQGWQPKLGLVQQRAIAAGKIGVFGNSYAVRSTRTIVIADIFEVASLGP